jgi:predicted dehydrogenase
MKNIQVILIGLGKIASSLDYDDPVMRKSVKYSTHAKVLQDHPVFELSAGVDLSTNAREFAQKHWGIEQVISSIDQLENPERYEVAVIATPPDKRLEFIKSLPSLKAVVVEKPLGITYRDSKEFIRYCEENDIGVQVNLTRRADKVMEELAKGGLKDRIGNVQSVFGVYGNGILNNGTHMIDLIRMIIGEVNTVQALYSLSTINEGPIKGDINCAFALSLADQQRVVMMPIKFSHYRENTLDIWGEKGRIEIVHEGLDFIYSPAAPCRSLSGASEIAADQRIIYSTDYSMALYNLYDNLAGFLMNGEELVSSGNSALKTSQIIETIIESYFRKGEVIPIK